MIMLPELTHMADSHVIIRKKTDNIYQFTMDDSSNIRYQNGIITESNGFIYLDIASPNGAMTFIFSRMEKLVSFLLKHADKSFIDLE